MNNCVCYVTQDYSRNHLLEVIEEKFKIRCGIWGDHLRGLGL